MGKVITVWGSPGSGKSMFCCILAKALTRDKRKAIIINAEISVPMLPVWLPEQIIQTNTSIGQVLSSVEIDTSLVASHVTVLKNYPFIGMMGYAAGENPLSYPEVKYAMVLQLIHAAAKLVDFVILDCSTSMTNVFTPAAIEAGDVVIFFNYRNDRAKELTVVLTQHDMPEEGMHTLPGLQYYCMTPYDASFTGVHILFPKENVENTLGEYLANNGKKQLHIAETEKYAHVTFFFNGGREAPYEGEERILVPSPKVATYDLKPEMSAYEVADKLAAAIREDKYDFVVVNFANGDMVGHTGVYDAIEKAVAAVDNCVKTVVEAAKATGYETIIIADHGNADNAVNPDGTPNTAHSLNPVPCVYVSDNANATVENGRLADVAPTILHILGMPQPAEMTGHNLVKP